MKKILYLILLRVLMILLKNNLSVYKNRQSLTVCFFYEYIFLLNILNG